MAQRHFTRNGYEATKVREVADEAGVNVALVNRYFGSKEGLFRQAVIDRISIADMLDGERATFGERMAALIVSKADRVDALDPTLAFVRSIGSPTVGPELQHLLEHTIVPELANWLGGRNAQQRASLILSQLLGFEMMKRMVRLPQLGPEHTKAVLDHLARSLQACVDHE